MLNSLRVGIIDDDQLPRSAKVSFFNKSVLEQLCELLELNDASISRICCPKDPLRTISVHAFEFLGSLCLKPGSGICYTDSGWYPPHFSKYMHVSDEKMKSTKRVHNVLLLRMLPTLKIVTDMKQRELFLSILNVCPELVDAFWSGDIRLSFEPRSSVYYIGNVSLAKSVISLAIPERFGFKGDSISIPPPVAVCLSNILPKLFTRVLNSRALQMKSIDSRFACIQLLISAFKKLNAVLLYGEQLVSTIPTTAKERWEQWKVEISTCFIQQIPDAQIIISLFSKDMASETDDLITPEEYQCALLSLLSHYQKSAQDSFLESRFDFGKIVPADLSAAPVSVQGHIISVLSNIPDFKWYNAPKKEESYLGMFIRLYLLSKDMSVIRSCEKLLTSFLKSSFLFRGFAYQIPMLWRAIRRCKQCEALNLAAWISECLSRDSKNPLIFIDLLSGLSQKTIGAPEFAPLLIFLIESLSDESPDSVKIFVLGLVQEMIPSSGSITCAIKFHEIISKMRSEGKEDFFVHIMRFLGVFLPTVEVQNFESLLTVKQINHLQDNGGLGTFSSIFSLNPTTVLDNWAAITEKSTFDLPWLGKRTYLAISLQLVGGIGSKGIDLEKYLLPLHFYIRACFLEGNCTQYYGQLVQDLLRARGFEAIQNVLSSLKFWSSVYTKNATDIFARTCQYFEIMLKEASTTSQKLWMQENLFGSPFFYQQIFEMKNGPADCLAMAILANHNVVGPIRQLYAKNLLRFMFDQKSLIFPKNSLDIFEQLSQFLSVDDKDRLAESILDHEYHQSQMNPLAYCLSTSLRILSSQIFDKLLKRVLICQHEGIAELLLKMIVQNSTRIAPSEPNAPFAHPAMLVESTQLIQFAETNSLASWEIVCALVTKSSQHISTILKWFAENGKKLTDLQLEKLNTALFPRAFVYDAQHGLCWREGVSKELCECIKSISKRISKPHFKRIKSFLCKEDTEGLLLWTENDSELLNVILLVVGDKTRKKLDFDSLSESNVLLSAVEYQKSLFVLLSVLNSCMSAGPFFKLVLNVIQNHIKSAGNEYEHVDTTFSAIVELCIPLVAFNGDWDYCYFVKESLKLRLHDPVLMILLHRVVEFCDLEELGGPGAVLTMITDHPRYKSILEIPQSMDIDGKLNAKPFVLGLIETVIRKNPKVCAISDVLPDIAANYYGSLSKSDVAALSLFNMCEEVAGVPVLTHLSNWGHGNDYSTKAMFQPSECLANVNPLQMANSIHWFPFDRDITSLSGTAPTARTFSARSMPLYDPAFFLPLLAVLFKQFQQSVDAHRLVESNALGLAVMGLSSHAINTRIACHFIMSHSYSLIEQSNMKEKNQVMLFLNVFRNGLVYDDDVPVIVPSLISSFAAQCLMIILKPDSDMYPLINQFCLQRPVLDFDDIPMFYSLFYSTSNECRKERIWILRLILRGINTVQDYRILQRRHVFEILMKFFVSPVADSGCRKIVLEVSMK